MIYNFSNNFTPILQKIYKDKYNFSEELQYFHYILESELVNEEDRVMNKKMKIILKNDRQSIFYDDYHRFIDNNSSFNKVYYTFVNEYIKPMYRNKDNKIIVQKTPNLRISFPNLTAIGKHEYESEDEAIIGLHKDADFGHHREEINIIIPITQMFETNSLYYEPYTESNSSYHDYINLHLNTDEFFVEKLNNLLHFNKRNITGLTRISLDFRIIPYDKYMENLDYFKNTKFELGKYYTVL
jgi:hypothetical protein